MYVLALIALVLPLSCFAADEAGAAGHASGVRAALQSVGGGGLAGLLIAVVFFLSMLPRRPGDTSWRNHVGQSFLFAVGFGVFSVVVGAGVGVAVAVMQWSRAG